MQKLWAALARVADTLGVLGFTGIAGAVGAITTGVAYISPAAPSMNSVEWLFVFLGVTATVLALMALAGFVAKQWRHDAPSVSVSPAASAVVTQNQVTAPVRLQEVTGVDFVGNQVAINIDNKHFINCSFKDCTMLYNGGAYKLTNCRRLEGHMMFMTTDRKIYGAMHLFNFIGLLKEGNMSAAEIPLNEPQRSP